MSTTYYPELDHDEIRATIHPLDAVDAEVRTLLQVGSASCTHQMDPSRRTDEWVQADEDYPFQRVIRTRVARAVDLCLSGSRRANVPDDAVAVALLDGCETRLQRLSTRALVAGLRHAADQGKLDGRTPEARYTAFVDAACATSVSAASGTRFDVLEKLTVDVLADERAALVELVDRLGEDRAALNDHFDIGTDDAVVSIGASDGDVHNHGRSVRILAFASGRRLVYKPRDVSCEAAFGRLATKLATHFHIHLAAADVLDRGGHGYVEFVSSDDVSDMSGSFMERSGELAGVLYLLNARDMHFDNILATRRGPVPIDLETILHPDKIHLGPTPEAPGNAYTTIARSIYGIGILPLVMAGRDTDSGHVDLGFLGEQGAGTSPFKSIRMLEPFTDRMRLALEGVAPAPRRTVVTTVTAAETHEHGRRMAMGFTRVCRKVMADLPLWIELLTDVAADVVIRYVHNPTALYAQTLRMSASARALADVDHHLALLKRIGIASKSSDRRIAESEIRQMARRDVPYFTVGSNDTVLVDGDGNPTGASFDRPPLQVAIEKAEGLDDHVLGAELGLLHSAFASRFPDNHLVAPARAGATGPALSPTTTTSRLHDVLTELTGRLVASARTDRFAHLPRTWIGPLASAEQNRPWPPGVLGYDLYTGRTGPALALAAAGRTLMDPDAIWLATQIFGTTATILADQSYETRSLRQAGYGAYTGLAGTLFALFAAGTVLNEPDWIRTAQGAIPLVLGQIAEEPSDRTPLDIISGLSGVLTCVAAIGGDHGASAATMLSGRLCDSLDAPGTPRTSVLEQSGFAHGISGVVSALCRTRPMLSPASRAPVDAAVAKLIERLHRFADPDTGTWLSREDARKSAATGWCHGATGIALALSDAVDSGAVTTTTLNPVVDNVLASGFGRNLTWCHGDLGSHDVLQHLTNTHAHRLAGAVEQVESTWLQPAVLQHKIADPTSRYAHTSSLLVGTAGIIIHLVNRLDPRISVSPVTLRVDGGRR